jgi:hypothetical protein
MKNKVEAIIEWDIDRWVVEIYENGRYSPPSWACKDYQEAEDKAAHFNLYYHE